MRSRSHASGLCVMILRVLVVIVDVVIVSAITFRLDRAEELEMLVTGTSELDFSELAKTTKYDGGYHEDHPTVKAFWEAVEDMSVEEQKHLLMFATGSTKVVGQGGIYARAHTHTHGCTQSMNV